MSDEKSENLAAEAVRGLVFFGVPHRGMDIKSLIPMVTGNPNEELIQSLNKYKVDGKEYQAFPVGVGDDKPEVVYFYETSKSSTAIKASQFVVTKMIREDKLTTGRGRMENGVCADHFASLSTKTRQPIRR